VGRRWGTVAVVGLALVAACSTPERVGGPTTTGAGAATTTTGPRQDATLQGRILSADGRPLGGVSVSVVRTHTGFRVGRVLEAVATFGLSCVASPDDCPFRDEQVVDTAVTDGEGRYALTLPKAYLPGYETDDDWVASVGRPPTPAEATGPSSSVELEVNAAVQSAPDLALWDAEPRITTAGGQLVVGLPRLQGAAAAGTVVRFATPAGATVWTVHGATDPRVLEDAALRVVASGHDDVTVHHAEGRTIYHQDLHTASVPYQGHAVPVSRGVPCTLDQTPATGCPLTDGDLVTGTEHRAGAIATVDLGRTQDLGLVVVRASDAAAALTLETSTDGQRWAARTLGPLVGAPGAVATPAHLEARYLRVGSSGAGSISEVSAWPPAARAAPPSAPSHDGEGSGWTTGRVLVAVLAALLAGGIGAVAVSRLRRSGPPAR
jgi:hypothetical protein